MDGSVVVIVLCIFAVAIALGALIGVLILVFTGNQKENSMPGVFRGSETSMARSWHMDLYDVNTGIYISKDFCGQVMLGRGGQGMDAFWRMSLGPYPTISREQCIVYDRGGFLMVENVSSVNITQINGYPLTRPYMLTKGCQLSAGGVNFYLADLYRVN